MNVRRRLLLGFVAVVAAAGLSLGTPQPVSADEGGNNVAKALNTRDGASLFRLAFKIRKLGGDVVESTNAAVAVSRCERCRTVAIAIQIVLVTGSPSVVTPQNVAVALNEQCTLCETFAGAYQFVLGVDGPVRFTDEGRRELAAIRRELLALRAAELGPADLAARVSVQIDRLRGVLATQLQPSGGGPDEDETEQEERDEHEAEVTEPAQPAAPASGSDERMETIQPSAPTTTSTTETETETSPTATTETVAP
jgi:hypothetical protein